MARKDDPKSQIETQVKINRLLAQRTAMLERQGSILSQQAEMAQAMCSALDCSGLDELESKLGGTQEVLASASGKAKELGQSMEDAANSGVDAGEKQQTMWEKIKGSISNAKVFAVGFGVGLINGFNTLIGLGKALIDVVGRVASAVYEFGKSIVMIPFQILSTLIDMAQQGGGMDHLRQAFEKLRGEVGNLAQGMGKNLKKSVRLTRKEMRSMAGTGLKMSRVFGYGREGLAKYLEENAELAQALGTSFTGLAEKLDKKAYQKLMIYRKGLGLTAEQQAKMMKVAKSRGEDFIQQQARFLKYAKLMGKQFNVSTKVMAKGMAELSEDMEHFGHLGEENFAALISYTHQLGIEIKTLGQTVDKFLDFDSAAESAANLAAGLGIQVDTFKLMQGAAQGGAGAIDELRRGFFASGKTLDQMDLAQRRYLEQQTGLTGTNLEAAFSYENQHKTMDEMNKAAKKAKDTPLDQAKALKELTKSIEKLVHTGSRKYKSFWDAFVGGFERGIMMSSEFRLVLRRIRRSLRVVERAGMKVARLFLDHFPGVKDLLKGLADFFHPAKFRKAMGEIVTHFGTFFKMLEKDPRKALDVLFDNILGTMRKFFSGQGGAFQLIKNAFKTISILVIKLRLEMYRKMVEMAAKGLKFLASALREGVSVPEEASEFGGEIGGAFIDGIKEIWKTAKEELFPAAAELWDVLGPRISSFFSAIGNWLMDNAGVLGCYMWGAVMFALNMMWEGFKALPIEYKLAAFFIVFRSALLTGFLGLFKWVLFKNLLPAIGARLFPQFMAQMGIATATPLGTFFTMLKAKLASGFAGILAWGKGAVVGLTMQLSLWAQSAATAVSSIGAKISTAASGAAARFPAASARIARAAQASQRVIGPALRGIATHAGTVLKTLAKGSVIVTGAIALGSGIINGVSDFMSEKGSIGSKVEAGVKGFATNYLSALSMGIVDSEEIEQWADETSTSIVDWLVGSTKENAQKIMSHTAETLAELKGQFNAYSKWLEKQTKEATDERKSTYSVQELIKDVNAGLVPLERAEADAINNMNARRQKMMDKSYDENRAAADAKEVLARNIIASAADFKKKADAEDKRTSGFTGLLSDYEVSIDTIIGLTDKMVEAAEEAGDIDTEGFNPANTRRIADTHDAALSIHADLLKKASKLREEANELNKKERKIAINSEVEMANLGEKTLISLHRAAMARGKKQLAEQVKAMIDKKAVYRIEMAEKEAIENKLMAAAKKGKGEYARVMAAYGMTASDVEETFVDAAQGGGFLFTDANQKIKAIAERRARNAVEQGTATGLEGAERAVDLAAKEAEKKAPKDPMKEKLDALEAAAETVERIKKLSGIQEELTALKKKMKGLDPVAIGTAVEGLLETLGKVSQIVQKKLKASGLNVPADVAIKQETVDLFTDLGQISKTMKESYDAIKGLPQYAELTKVFDNFVNSMQGVLDDLTTSILADDFLSHNDATYTKAITTLRSSVSTLKIMAEDFKEVPTYTKHAAGGLRAMETYILAVQRSAAAIKKKVKTSELQANLDNYETVVDMITFGTMEGSRSISDGVAGRATWLGLSARGLLKNVGANDAKNATRLLGTLSKFAIKIAGMVEEFARIPTANLGMVQQSFQTAGEAVYYARDYLAPPIHDMLDTMQSLSTSKIRKLTTQFKRMTSFYKRGLSPLLKTVAAIPKQSMNALEVTAKILADLRKIDDEFKSASGKMLLEVGSAITSGKTVRVRHSGVTFKATLNVTINAHKLAKAIIEIADEPDASTGGKKITTSKT